MRFTLKDDEYWIKSDNQYKAFQKLGQLEDIEEKHNIKSVEDLDKRLTAFEIIKNKGVNVHAFIWLCLEDNRTYKQYVDDFNFADGYYDLGKELLTQEEYDLLKEVMEELL